MNGVQKKGLLALSILTIAVFATMFTTVARATHIHVSQSGDPDAETACTGTGDSQVGNCTGGDGAQSGDQSVPDNAAEPVEAED